jgi:hypothetical protein
MKHTPIPWKVKKCTPSGFDEDVMILGPNDEVIDWNNEDDAQFIVKACNEYEGLLELAAEGLYYKHVIEAGLTPAWKKQIDEVQALWRDEALTKARET